MGLTFLYPAGKDDFPVSETEILFDQKISA